MNTTKITGDELLLISTMIGNYIEVALEDERKYEGEALETLNGMKTLKNKIDRMLSEGEKLLRARAR